MSWNPVPTVITLGVAMCLFNVASANHLRRIGASSDTVAINKSVVANVTLKTNTSLTTNNTLNANNTFKTNTTIGTSKVGLDFFFWGDWGHNVPSADPVTGQKYVQLAIAKQIGNFAAVVRPSFMCLLGDNFYNSGVNSTTDPLWDSYYRRVYIDPATYVPWYPVFGNHDYYQPHGRPQAQIDFWKKHMDSRWNFPDYQYTRKWLIPGTNKSLEIVFINTITLCPEIRSGQIGMPTSQSAVTSIWQPVQKWIASALASSTATYTLVVGHYNVYSNSEDNDGVTGPEFACMHQRLVPLMQKYGAAAYLHGHMHNFQHHFLDGISYINVGHGSDLASSLKPGSPHGLLFNMTIGGFARIHIGPTNMVLYFIDVNGKYIYSAKISNPAHRRRMAALAAQN